MFNWSELEAIARMRIDELGACLSDADVAHMAAIRSLRASRRPLRARLGAALVRIGARLDPPAAAPVAHDDGLLEGRLAAYLR